MADIEADWLYVEVLEQLSLPPAVAGRCFLADLCRNPGRITGANGR
jgi:hypothetical protein